MTDSTEQRGHLINHLEQAFALADELGYGNTGYLIERALDARSGVSLAEHPTRIFMEHVSHPSEPL
jgi:hypothetical protein